MPQMPTEFDEIVIATNDGFRRQLRYKADGATSWTNLDLTDATEIHVDLLRADGTTARTFKAVTTDVALFTADASGYLEFQPTHTTFTAAHVGSYLLRVRVENETWPKGRTFPSAVGIRIVA